jgi:hypothetical protein
MSNFLAIATVTATLKNLLQNAISTDVPGANAETERPEDLENASEASVVNIYLYQVTPNTAYRNADLPTRNSDNQLVMRPQVALDLHYLLTFLGDDGTLVPQRLLGSVVRELHEHSVLTRGEIERVKDRIPYLTRSNLHEQVELVKFSPIVLNLEELSKLWSVFFQTAYRLSVAYQASVVLIEGEGTPRAILPVRERAVHGRTMQRPVIEKLLSQRPAPANEPELENRAIVAGDNIILVGKGFRGEHTTIRFDQEVISLDPPMVPSIEFSDTRIKFTLDDSTIPASALRVGKHCIQVVHQLRFTENGELHKGFESNPVFFILRPSVTVE